MNKDQAEAAGVMMAGIGAGMIVAVATNLLAGTGLLLIIVGTYLVARANT